MKKKFVFPFVLIIILISASYGILHDRITHEQSILKETKTTISSDFKNSEYIIDGKHIKLINGLSEIENTPQSAPKLVTRYFGNEIHKDINNDGKEDIVFLLTQNNGGSGTFFYVVAAIKTDTGYIGSQGLLLGDRIAPQTTKPGSNNSVIVTYADRDIKESFTVAPHIGKSITLILDTKTMQFGEIVQNFEGEADPNRMTLSMKKWIWIKTIYNDGKVITPNKPDVFTLTLTDKKTFSATTDCNGISGNYTLSGKNIGFEKMISTKIFCDNSQETDFRKSLEEAENYHFTSKGEFVFDLKLDSGTVLFR